MRRTTCRNPDCGKLFTPQRAGAQYCSGRCRTAAHRHRWRALPSWGWDGGREPRFNTASRALNADGTPALSRAELAERLLEIARRDDDPTKDWSPLLLSRTVAWLHQPRHERHSRGEAIAR